ncbi:MAG: hypothetical protein ACMXYD_04390 [Candidatus Woesearchaeota archaeon]
MTIITLQVSEESTKSIDEYLENNHYRARRAYHATAVYTEITPILENKTSAKPLKEALPLTINPPYQIERFGKGAAIHFENEQLNAISKELYSAGLYQLLTLEEQSPEYFELLDSSVLNTREGRIYPFVPHITILKDQYHAINAPTFPITFDSYNWWHQEDLFKKEEHKRFTFIQRRT